MKTLAHLFLVNTEINCYFNIKESDSCAKKIFADVKYQENEGLRVKASSRIGYALHVQCKGFA